MFEARADTPELLDSDDIDQISALQSYRFMAVVNKYFGGTTVVRDFIINEARLKSTTEPLRIMDIGSGACDIPAAICKWAQTIGLRVEFTCVEPSIYAAQAARQNIARHQNITLVQEDIFAYEPKEAFDCAIGSLFFHHLTNERIVEVIDRLRSFGCKSVLINDLHRSRSCYVGCWLACLFVSADVRHDALLSIKKAFKPDELRRLLEEPTANKGDQPVAPTGRATHVSVRTAWFGRMCAIVRFTTEDSR